jgi:hypothetical protein
MTTNQDGEKSCVAKSTADLPSIIHVTWLDKIIIDILIFIVNDNDKV